MSGDDCDGDALKRSLLSYCEDWLQRGCDDARIQAHPTNVNKCVRVLDRHQVVLDPALFDDYVPDAEVIVAEPQPGDQPSPPRQSPTIPPDMFLMRSVPRWAREPRRRVVRVVPAGERRLGQQIVYYCHECFRIPENVALWMALWMGRSLSLPVIVIMTTEPSPSHDLRALMAPPHQSRRLHSQRTMRDALHLWGVPALLFRATDPIVVLRAWTARHSPHVIIADEFVTNRSRLQFDVFAKTLPFSVFAFTSDLACSGLFDLNSVGQFDADAVRQRFLDDVDKILFEMMPSKVPDGDVQAPLFVAGTRRVYLDVGLVKQLGVPDAVPPGTLTQLSGAELIELGLESPFRAAHLVDDHVRRQHAIWMATRAASPPNLPCTNDGILSIGYQEISKAMTTNAEFNAVQDQLRSKKFLRPDDRRRWARLLWQLVPHMVALSWACSVLESYAGAIRRPILEFQLYLDMTSD